MQHLQHTDRRPRGENGLVTRLSKVRAMSARELAERFRYAAFCRAEHRRHAAGRLAPPERLRLALVPELRDSKHWADRLLESRFESACRFFSSVVERDAMRGLFASEFRSEAGDAMAQASRVLQRQVTFFGHTFQLGEPVAWNCDPVSGSEWPRVYHRDVPVHGNRGFGDVKYVWELNRQQFLIDLGRASFLTDSPEYARAARRLVSEWVADNPYATGVNWAIALEPAFRVLSWLWSYYLCLDREQSEPEHHLLWVTSFYDHGRFLHRHLEHYTSPFNHLIGEACALYMLGVLFPECAESVDWRKRGRHVLESRLHEQFYRDGGSVEQSTFYHHATLGFYLLAMVLGVRNGEPFAEPVHAAVERAIEFSMSLLQPDGRVPGIGGADDGKPIRMEHLPFWDFRPYQAIGAVLFGRGDFKFAAGRFFEDALWVLGPDGLRQFNAIQTQPPASSSLLLRESGYAILRSDWSPDADYVCVDCGEQAGGLRTDSVPNSVHGHADALSVVMALAGKPVLVDSGLLCYNGDALWEAHFRETAAHNTARIDAADQALHLGKMAWSYSYRVAQEWWSSAAGEAAVMASHDGYTRRGGDTAHRRLVWLRPDHYVVVYDEFDCGREHDLELNYQFAPGELRLVHGAGAHHDHADVIWATSMPLQPEVRCGGETPAEGWIAPSLGVRLPAPRLTLKGRIGPASAAMVVFAVPGRDATDMALSCTDGVIEVRGRSFVDYIGALKISPAVLQGTTDAPVAIWRFEHDRCAGAAQVGGTHVGHPPAFIATTLAARVAAGSREAAASRTP
jgi:hypothetical protein